MVSTLVSIPGYRITEELYNGSRTIVVRGNREADSLKVVIKLLKNPYPSFSELLSFRHQYTITKNLNSPLIVQSYSLEPYQNGYALVMEDFGGVSLKEYFTSDQTRYIASGQEFLQIAIALCNILDVLYRERIIHKDIKPANILINPETKQVKLIDFSIASLLPRETQTLVNPNVLEGTLAYISPEQTGRMNRLIDYRTDFYSLGVTFYELLTGELPFASNDPMELVHSHMAKLPEPLSSRREKEIPQVLSDIIMKLMAKNAEDRYQSVLGLKFDLENCLHQLQETGNIDKFEIGQRDVCVGAARRRHRFIIPDKLYGRKAEVSTLLQAFERVSLGATEIMLVAGFSGIGKTAVVNEVHKPIVRQRGYFIKGKYDQFNRNIPLSAFVQAFRDLMGQLLSETDEQLVQWKDKILSALGDNGQVLIEVIPELEQIIGKQPPAPELSVRTAQNRFNLLFQKFIAIFTKPEHPLVMFLDDLQWADSASLKLMQVLMSQNEVGYLFIMGAYRDNEVFPAHPLMLTLEEMKKAEATVNTLILNPLSQTHINDLIVHTLSCSTVLALPLTELVYQKTKGSPFFATQFLKALHEDGQIVFNRNRGYWECDIAQITARSLTDDVVEFMQQQLHKLSSETQQILKLAACIGNRFDLNTLAIVSEQAVADVADALWKALQEGLILPQSEVYKFYFSHDQADKNTDNIKENVAYQFLHDRVQQAAYSLISDEKKQAMHLKIGQLLLNNTPPTELDENLFEIVNQLNIGKSLIFDLSQQIQLAELNFQSGQKARAATAYTVAFEYATTGIALINFPQSQEESCWQTQYKLTLSLHELAAETAYLSGDFQQMEQWVEMIMQQAKAPIDKMKVYAVKIQAYMAQVKKIEAVKIGLEALQLVGISLPESPDFSDIQQAQTQTINNLQGKKIEDLINLPLMTDIEKLAAARMLASMAPPTYQAIPILFPLVMCELVNLSVKYGNSPFSSYGYACYGGILKAFQDADSAYRFGNLALTIAEQFNAPEIKASVLLVVGSCTTHDKVHVRETLPILWDGYQTGLESGNFEFAAYSAIHKCQHLYLIGQELSTLEREMATISDVLARLKQENALAWNRIFQQSVVNLLNPSKNPYDLRGEVYDEEISLPLLQNANDRSELHYIYFNKLILGYLFREYKEAQKIALQAESYLDAVQGLLVVSVFHFYDSLAHLAIYPLLSHIQQEHLLNRVNNNQEKMKQWATQAPMNFKHKFDLVAAEQCRILGKKADAIELYDRAISGAKENSYIQEEALANELAGRFYLEWDKQRIAQEYMIEAYYGYTRWGALAKVADLERNYPQLLAPILQQTRPILSVNETLFATGTSTSSTFSNSLDLTAIVKASHAISSEIELEKLLSLLLSIVIENAGADKCVLMLSPDDSPRDTFGARLLIEGSITVGTEPVVLQRLPIEDSQDIPLKLIYKVKRNRQTVVLLDTNAEPTLANDPYIMRQQPKSILCSPILHQGKLLGVLYLENNLTVGAFTADRVELLNLLCSQAAISLENARLYWRSQNYAQQLERSLNDLNTAQSRFHNLVDNVPGVVYQYCMSVDGILSLNYISADCYSLYEITPEQAAANAKFFDKMVHPDDIASYQQCYTDTFETLSPWHWEGRIITPSGIKKWIHGESRTQRLADGSIIWDGLFLDISDRKKAELALEQKSLDLQQAMLDLQQAQLQIIQSEKMSALGNLVAGVAHEMNNPLGFIAASLKQAKPTFADLVEHLKLYQETCQNPSDKIIDHAVEIDLEYSLEDLPKMLDSMTMACDRLKNISTSLRTFSRADKDYKVPFNIHQGIDSTILILKHRLKANEQRPAIEVVTNSGDLPPIECFPGQLNQVFMNILANAIDALEESNNGRSFEEIKANPNRITITTSLENNYVKIAIADNGKGMSESVKQKIFDHLFTTKAVGKGTGLGLAIARQIVEETHGGKLSFNSVLGEGTEFLIEIPG